MSNRVRPRLAQGLPLSALMAGAEMTVNSAGSTSGSASQDTGMDTGAPGRARTDHADAIVRSRAIWL